MKSSETNSVKDTVAQVRATVAEEGRKAAEATGETLKDLADSAKDTVRDHAAARAEEGRDLLADQADRLADNLRTDTDSSDNKGLRQRLMATVADSISELSADLRDKSPADLWSDVQRMARQNPGAFAAAAGLAGFAAARFIIASDLKDGGYQKGGGYQRDHVGRMAGEGQTSFSSNENLANRGAVGNRMMQEVPS